MSGLWGYMDGNQFAQHLLSMSQEAENFINNEAPVIMGKEAVDFFQEGFQNEGFTDASLEPWKEVKRRQDPKVKGARASRKILTGDTGDLGMSIESEVIGNGETEIKSDKPYSQAQNEGTDNAGRNRNVTIPKRQFIGDSQELDKRVLNALQNRSDEFMK